MSEGVAALTGVAEAGAEAEVGGGEAQVADTPAWMEGFDADTLAYAQNKGWSSPNEMLQSYRNLEKFAGGSKSLVEVPGVDATDEQMASFYDRLGRPSNASEYGFEMPEGGDENLMNWFGDTAHRYGLSAKQANAIFNEFNEMSNSRVEAMEYEQKQANEAELTELKREWGSDYEHNLDAGKRAVAALGYDQDALSNLENKLGTGDMMRLFSTIGARMGEDSFVSGNEAGGFGTSPAQAAQQINDLKADAQFMEAYMAGDRAAISKMQRLMEQAHG